MISYNLKNSILLNCKKLSHLVWYKTVDKRVVQLKSKKQKVGQTNHKYFMCFRSWVEVDQTHFCRNTNALKLTKVNE